MRAHLALLTLTATILVTGYADTPADATTPTILVCATENTGPCTYYPLCPTEDSTECVWVSPRTGDAYLNPTTEEMNQ